VVCWLQCVMPSEHHLQNITFITSCGTLSRTHPIFGKTLSRRHATLSRTHATFDMISSEHHARYCHKHIPSCHNHMTHLNMWYVLNVWYVWYRHARCCHEHTPRCHDHMSHMTYFLLNVWCVRYLRDAMRNIVMNTCHVVTNTSHVVTTTCHIWHDMCWMCGICDPRAPCKILSRTHAMLSRTHATFDMISW